MNLISCRLTFVDLQYKPALYCAPLRDEKPHATVLGTHTGVLVVGRYSWWPWSRRTPLLPCAS